MSVPTLVLDGEQRSALAITRSLGTKGVPVIVVSDQPNPIAAQSKYAMQFRRIPDLTDSPGEALGAIAAMCSELDIGVVMPATDASTMLLHSGPTLPATIACANAASYETVTDKSRLLQTALSLDIPCPETILVKSAESLESVLDKWNGPVVIKPARSKFFHDGKIISTTVIVKPTAEQALNAIRTKTWYGKVPCLVQQYIDGTGMGLFALYRDGEVIAEFCHRRIREKPPGGGVSVCSESAPIHAQIAGYSRQLLHAAKWHGPAMVEYRVDNNGMPFLMEINGRFWGSLQLSIDSGIDFPWLLYQIALGRSVQPVANYRIPQRLRWILGELDHIILCLRDPAIPRMQKVAVVGRFLNPVQPHTKLEVLRLSDFRPFLQECRNWIRDLKVNR